MRRDGPGHDRLALAERRGEPEQLGRHERERLLGEPDVRRRVQPHEDEVLALGEDVLVDLLRPLRGDQQVQPELAALRGDRDRVHGRPRRDRVAARRRADVVRLVDHHERRRALGAAPPELAEHAGGDHRLLLARAQRAEVGHDHPSSGRPSARRARSRRARPPRLPADDAEVRRPLGARRAPGASRSPARRGRRAARRAPSRRTRRTPRGRRPGPAGGSTPGSPARARRSAAAAPRSLRTSIRTAIAPAPRQRSAAPARRRARASAIRAKSEFGSSTTIRRSVSSISCSSISPSEYVLPDPDCPHRNVWRPKPAASRANGTPGEPQLADRQRRATRRGEPARTSSAGAGSCGRR